MKKALIVLLAVALVGAYVFAEDAAVPASPLAVTGSVGFSIGNSDMSADQPTSPVMTVTKDATAKLAIATTDEKVKASIGVNLLALPTVAALLPITNDHTLAIPAESYYNPGIALDYSTWDVWAMFKAGLGIYTANSGSYAFRAADFTKLTTDMKAAKWKSGKTYDNGTTKTAVNVNDPVASDLKDAADVTAFVNQFTNVLGPDLSALFDNMVIDTVKDAKDATVKALNSMVALKNYLLALRGYDNTASIVAFPGSGVWEGLASADQAALKKAADIVLKYDNAIAVVINQNYALSTTVTGNFITSASLAFPKVFGVVDITAFLTGSHAAAGSLNADRSGHQSDAVASYPGLSVALASDVVPGLSVGATLWDDSNSRVASSEKWYTIFKNEGANVESTLAYGGNVGYTLAIGEDMSVGASVAVAQYSTTSDHFALSIKPAFSGFGAKLTGEYASLGTDISYITAAVSYAIMGITPSVTFYQVKGPVVYNSSPLSVIDNLKDNGGTAIAAGLGVDLKALASLPFAASISFSLIDDLTNVKLGWNAGASVTPLDSLTVALAAGHDDVNGGASIDYSAKVSYKYSAATVSASYGTAYNNGGGEYRAFWSLGTSVSF